MEEETEKLLELFRSLVPQDEKARPEKANVVIAEYMSARRAERLSERTLEDYSLTYKRFLAFIGPDARFDEITAGRIREFIGSLDSNLSKKTVLNVHVALSSLWTWAVREKYAVDHIVRRVTPPKPEERSILPLSDVEVKKLLATLEKDKERNRAIILFLLDTGVRASELSSLTIEDIEGEYVKIFGKGSKERRVAMSRRTMRALVDYLSQRGKISPKAPVFVVGPDGIRPISRHTLRKMLARLGERAGVPNVHPHRFRHTMAVTYLRNGGDAISLQKVLGHSTLDMVKTYVQLAEDDLREIHRRASPVENWGL